MSERLDARSLNWRFVVPGEPDGMLLLPVDGERLGNAIVPDRTAEGLHSALRLGPYPAVAVPDLGSWSPLVGSSTQLMGMLADAVLEGGWLYTGFANALFPGHPLSRGSLRLEAAHRCFGRRGSWTIERFVPMPDQRCPAYLVPTARSEEMDYFLRRLFFPYAGGDQRSRSRIVRRGLWMARIVALASPAWTRVQLAPAFALVARRSP
jgi:hypothetical protein